MEDKEQQSEAVDWDMQENNNEVPLWNRYYKLKQYESSQ